MRMGARDGDVGVHWGAEVSRGVPVGGQSHGEKTQGPPGRRGRGEDAGVQTLVR